MVSLGHAGDAGGVEGSAIVARDAGSHAHQDDRICFAALAGSVRRERRPAAFSEVASEALAAARLVGEARAGGALDGLELGAAVAGFLKHGRFALTTAAGRPRKRITCSARGVSRDPFHGKQRGVSRDPFHVKRSENLPFSEIFSGGLKLLRRSAYSEAHQ